MSALSAIWRPGGVAEDAADAVGARLAHRGHPGSTVTCPGVALRSWQRGPVATSQSDGLLVVADARLDDGDDLARQLDLPAGTDAARLIARAWRRWGDAAWERLRGDWAAVLVDPERGELIAARDLIGVRPLCWARVPGGGLAVATEAQALRALPGVGDRIDEWGVACELLALHHDHRVTAWAGIERLEAAHRLHARVPASGRLQVRVSRYGWPRPAALTGDAATWVAVLRATMHRAVSRRRGQRDRVLLSGGLDSSFVAGLLAGGGGVEAISMVMPGTADELSFQRAMADASHLPWRRYTVLEEDPTQGLAELRARCGSLTWGPIIQLRDRLLDADGLVGGTVFDGHEGDAVATAGMSRPAGWWRSGAGASALAAGLRLWRGGSIPTFVRATRWAAAPLLPRGLLRRWRDRRRGRAGPWAWSCIDPAFAARLDAAARIEALAPPPELCEHGERTDRLLYLAYGDVVSGLEYCDLIAARHGAHAAHPFCDRDVVECCLAMPAAMSLAGSWQRPVLRRAMAGVVPDRIRLRRDKGTLGDPFTQAVAAACRTRGAGERRLPEAAGGLVCPDRYGRVVDRLQGGAGCYRDAVDWWLIQGLVATLSEPGGIRSLT